MQPLQNDLRSPATKKNNITYAAKTGSNLDAATTMRSAKTELQAAIPFTLREQSYSYKPEWNSIGNLSISNTCNLIYIAGNDPANTNHNGIPSATHLPAPLAIPFTLRERSYSYKSQWNSVDRTCTKTLQNPFTMRNRSDHDPRMSRPHTKPSRTRRTAQVDHRGSGTDFVWKNTGFRTSAISQKHTISQKHISCETSFKTPSATHPPAPLAIPFTLRERSYSYKSQ